MKRIALVVLAVVTLSCVTVQAQEMKKGSFLLNAGLGLYPIGVNVSGDYGLIDHWGPGIFTVGGFAGFSTWGHSYGAFGYSWKYREYDFIIAPRATYRYAINDKFEVYGVAIIGLGIETYTWGSDWDDSDYKPESNRSYPAVGASAGCRYQFAPNMSVFAEVGYGSSYLNGGLSFGL